MTLYKFSPIKNKTQLMKALTHVHTECHNQVKKSLGKYLEVAGNIAIFCHYDEEYAFLEKLKKEMSSDNTPVNGKYFKLHKPIIITAKGGVPKAIYTHLYIRKPDPYRSQVGDIDVFLHDAAYFKLKKNVEAKAIKGARIYPLKEPDMVELFDPDSDVLTYVSNWKIN